MEAEIDAMDKELPELTNFILPGGSKESAKYILPEVSAEGLSDRLSRSHKKEYRCVNYQIS